LNSKLNAFFESSASEEVKEKILLIDGHNLVHSSLYVAISQHPDDNNTGFPIWKNIICESVFSKIKKYQPNKVILAFDTKNSWRKEIYPEYKANRKVDPKSLINFEKFYPVLDTFIDTFKRSFSTIKVLKISRCESDDIIAILTKEFAKVESTEIQIVSADKDFMQLQKFRNVSQWDSIRDKVVKSLNPKKDLEIKLLTGDSGDNIFPLFKGCGPVTAEKLLAGKAVKVNKEPKTFDQVLNEEELKNKYLLNKTLISFEEIPQDIQDVILSQYNNYEVKEFNGADVWNFFIDNDCKRLAEAINSYVPLLKNLK
jgi:5'-3' exonuclease